jgi:Ca2+-binding RTX toxin-like protein
VISGAGSDLIKDGTGGTQLQLSDGLIATTQLAVDLLHGGAGNDRMYGNNRIALADAISAGTTATATGVKGRRKLRTDG